MTRSHASASRAVRSARVRRPAKATLTSGVVLLAFYVVVFFAAPSRLPLVLHHLVGLANATLVMLTVLFAAEELAGQRTWLIRGRRRPGRADAVAAIAFLAVLAWWLSPWAPIVLGSL